MAATRSSTYSKLHVPRQDTSGKDHLPESSRSTNLTVQTSLNGPYTMLGRRMTSGSPRAMYSAHTRSAAIFDRA